MAFVFELNFRAPHNYIKCFIEALAKEEGVNVSVARSHNTITLVGDEKDEKLSVFLQKLGSVLPASFHMTGSSHRIISEAVPILKNIIDRPLPHAVGLCTYCMKDIFDPASRRYYYPFTMCNCCGPQYPFFEEYPFDREHTLMRFFTPCKSCEKELASSPFRRDFPLISCHVCGVPVCMRDGAKERYANDAESFKTLFEVAAKALDDKKSVKIKTMAGWRLFFDASKTKREMDKVMLLTDAAQAECYCALIKPEVYALLSIERPLIHATVADESLRKIYGETTSLKYPDEGFTILLARELIEIGHGHIAYIPCDEDTKADFTIDFDLPIDPQRELRLSINKSVYLIVEGERGIFPQKRKKRSDRIVAAYGMAAVPTQEGMLFDRMEKIGKAEASQLWVLEGEDPILHHSNTRYFSQDIASVMSVLYEHEKMHESAIGCYFGKEPTFIFHNGKKPMVAVPAMAFSPKDLGARLSSLREGSDRLVENFTKKFPRIAEKLFEREEVLDIFDAAACIMELEDESLERVEKEALKFHGKGGLQIDTKLKNNRFDPYAFIASIMSYRLAGVESPLLAYSIFESFGDYVVEIITELKSRSKADNIVLCGRTFGNPSLFSRVQKKLGVKSFLMNESLPIDRENALFGALAL